MVVELDDVRRGPALPAHQERPDRTIAHLAQALAQQRQRVEHGNGLRRGHAAYHAVIVAAHLAVLEDDRSRLQRRHACLGVQAGIAEQFANQLRRFDGGTEMVLQLRLAPRDGGAPLPDVAANRCDPALAYPVAQLAAEGLALGGNERGTQRGPALFRTPCRQASARAARLVEHIDYPACRGERARTTCTCNPCPNDACPQFCHASPSLYMTMRRSPVSPWGTAQRRRARSSLSISNCISKSLNSDSKSLLRLMTSRSGQYPLHGHMRNAGFLVFGTAGDKPSARVEPCGMGLRTEPEHGLAARLRSVQYPIQQGPAHPRPRQAGRTAMR